MLLPGLVGSGALWRRACDGWRARYRAASGLPSRASRGRQAGHPAGCAPAPQPRRSVHRARRGRRQDERWLASARQALVEQNTEEHAGTRRHPAPRPARRRAPARLGCPLQAAHERRRQARRLGRGDPRHRRARQGSGPLAATVPEHGRGPAPAPPRRGSITPCAVLRRPAGHGGHLTCSPEVLQVLMRSNWPGNAEQLYQYCARSCSTGVPA